MSAGQLLTFILAGIALVTFLGAAAVYLRGSKDTGTIRTLRDNNQALTEKVTILEHDNAALNVRVDALEKANRVLTDTLTSRADIAELAGVIDSHNSFVSDWTAKVDAFMERVTKWMGTVDRWRSKIDAWFDDARGFLTEILRAVSGRKGSHDRTD